MAGTDLERPYKSGTRIGCCSRGDREERRHSPCGEEYRYVSTSKIKLSEENWADRGRIRSLIRRANDLAGEEQAAIGRAIDSSSRTASTPETFPRSGLVAGAACLTVAIAAAIALHKAEPEEPLSLQPACRCWLLCTPR